MAQSRLALRTFWLCVLTSGLMAIVMSSAAQAESGAHWTYINPSNGELEFFNVALKPLWGTKLDTSTLSFLFTTAGGTKVAITCTSIGVVGSPVLEENGSSSQAQTKYAGCKTFLNGAESKNCEPHSTGAAKGEIITKLYLLLIKLHLLTVGGAVDTTILLTPETKNAKGETSAIAIEIGELCAIGEFLEVTGDQTLIDCQNEFSAHKVEHLFEEFTKLQGLKILGQPAVTDGSHFFFLLGLHKGYKWAGLPSPTKP